MVVLPAESRAQGFERLCDTESEDCRAPLLTLIRNEKQGIDVAFWFMVDARYSYEIIQRFRAGVPVRVLVDEQANRTKPYNATILAELRDAGIPMRRRNSGGILHWKFMLFHGQNMVQFSGANYQGAAFVPLTPGRDWIDEAIYFTNDDAIVDSFRRKFDDKWTNTSRYVDYANLAGPPTRRYPLYAVASWLNFPPKAENDYGARAVARYARENAQIDVMMYRITDARHADALIEARRRGVRVRLITEPGQYRDPTKIWHAWNVDRLYMAGVQIKKRQHRGYMHQKSVILRGLGEVIFGSSNWTVPSAVEQDEHNLFYSPAVGKPWLYQWFVDQFERKWGNTAAFTSFQPLRPENPQYQKPSNGASGTPLSVTLRWDGGSWAHKYDIYFGTNPTPPLYARNVTVGSPLPGRSETITVRNLAPRTTYYWRVVGKTMANMVNSGSTWSFTTGTQ
jgi:phosphatidylserine/phosphatidylglycerophosphate/cardiolipin synthase-like enzyme